MTFELKLPLSASFAMLSLPCEMRNPILIYEIETTERVVMSFRVCNDDVLCYFLFMFSNLKNVAFECQSYEVGWF